MPIAINDCNLFMACHYVTLRLSDRPPVSYYLSNRANFSGPSLTNFQVCRLFPLTSIPSYLRDIKPSAIRHRAQIPAGPQIPYLQDLGT